MPPGPVRDFYRPATRMAGTDVDDIKMEAAVILRLLSCPMLWDGPWSMPVTKASWRPCRNCCTPGRKRPTTTKSGVPPVLHLTNSEENVVTTRQGKPHRGGGPRRRRFRNAGTLQKALPRQNVSRTFPSSALPACLAPRSSEQGSPKAWLEGRLPDGCENPGLSAFEEFLSGESRTYLGDMPSPSNFEKAKKSQVSGNACLR